MKKVALFSGLLLIGLITKAQTSVAITAGVNSASTTPHFLTYPDTVQKTALNKGRIMFGIVASVPIKYGLSFRTGVLYTARGSNWSQYYDTANLYASTKSLPEEKRQKLLYSNTILNVNYIDVPLNILYQLSVKGMTKLVIGGGPQLSLLYNGNKHYNTTSVSQAHPDSVVKYHYRQDVNEDLPIGHISGRFRIVHVGANVFGAIEFNRVFFTVNYSRSLNAFYEEEGRYYKHRTIGASIGIFLGNRPKAKPLGKPEGQRRSK
jgi:OmpA-OmpF porin, OOP family